MVEHSLGEDTFPLSHTNTHLGRLRWRVIKTNYKIVNNLFGYISGSQEPSVQMRWQWMP